MYEFIKQTDLGPLHHRRQIHSVEVLCGDIPQVARIYERFSNSKTLVRYHHRSKTQKTVNLSFKWKLYKKSNPFKKYKIVASCQLILIRVNPYWKSNFSDFMIKVSAASIKKAKSALFFMKRLCRIYNLSIPPFISAFIRTKFRLKIV